MDSRLFPPGDSSVLYLVDLSGYVFRAYHAIAPLNSPTGEPTQAVFGTVNMLERLVRERKPKLLAVAMDSRTPTFRKELYPAYKAHRPPPPEDLKVQMRRVSELIEAFPIHCFQSDGVEADDLIASVVRRCREQNIKVVIVSADKDLMQLVGDDVVLWDTMRDRTFGVSEVEARFGVKVAQVRDVLALMGDSSDNIPGVPSVGPKTASELISEYGNIAGIYEHLEEIKRKKLRETLAENREQAELSQKLVSLKDDLIPVLDLERLQFRRRNLGRLRELYTELGFHQKLAGLVDVEEVDSATVATPAAVEHAPAAAQVETALITSDQQLAAFAAQAKESGQFAAFGFTLGGSPMSAVLVGLGLAASSKANYYVPLGHRYMGAPKQLATSTVLATLSELCANGVKLIGHDLRSLLVTLRQAGATLQRADFDTLLASYLLDPDASHTLETLREREYGAPLPLFDELTRQQGSRTRLKEDEVPVERAAPAIAQRAAFALELAPKLETQLQEANLDKLWHELEQPLLLLLVELEQRGILLNSALLRRLNESVARDLSALEAKAHAIAGKTFNVNSPRQLEALLFDELKLKPLKRTKTSRSTDAATLESLSEQHELPQVILEIRQLAKLQGTYIETLPKLVHPKTGRLHTRWHQEVAATGRLSSSDPNLQNIPIRSELGRSIREAFIAPPGYVLISADYSQIELRVLAHLSQDAVLLDAFRRKQDIHLRTAMEIFEVDEAGVTKELRRRAKAVNFGVIYGQGDSALGKSLGIPRTEAGQFIAAYFRRHDGVRRYMDETLENARASGSVHTLLGRKRVIQEINDRNRARRLGAERMAMNLPIQGSAADILKLSMLKLRDPVTPNTRMLLTVHDELVFETPEAESASAMSAIQHAMQTVIELDVPLEVDIGAGPNWNAAH
jgi:DNA polymerase-1